MITAEEAVQILFDSTRGQYSSRGSYSCIKEFKLQFPKKQKPEFVVDKLAENQGVEPCDPVS